MNKRLLTAAVASALTAPTAMAGDVTIYGEMHISTTKYSGNINVANAWDISGHESHIGFKGSEPLGSGLTAIWQLELQVSPSDTNADTTNSADGITYRDSFIGLAGSWGTMLIGRHDTPLNISTASLDLFAGTIADYNLNAADDAPGAAGTSSVQTLAFTDFRVDQAIAYISPTMNGLTIAAAIVQPGMDWATAPDDADSFYEAYSIAAMYQNGPFYASIAYEEFSEDFMQEFTGSTTTLGEAIEKDSTWRLGLGYTANGFHIGFVHEDNDSGLGDLDFERWQLSGSYTFGNNVIKAMYGQHDLNGIRIGAVNTEVKQWAIGLDHLLSKRTKLYAVYTDANTSGLVPSGDWHGISFGMVHKF
jgi:predicted porin